MPDPASQTPPARHASNNFDLLRLAAAFLVLFSHAYVLTGHPAAEPIAILLRHTTDGGAMAVGAFFVLSGYLIARSAQIHDWRTYLRARALRIYPAFAVAVLAQTLLLGPLASTLGPTPYLTDPATWDALARAFLFSPRPGLPGVFPDNPLPNVVNGSLWTLRIEALCYIAMLLWAFVGARRWLIVLAVAAGFAALATAHANHAPLHITAPLDCILFFATGAALWCWRDHLPLRWWPLALLTLAFAALANTAASPYVWHLLLPYAVLRLGLSAPLLARPILRLGDISYGVYLYAFPLEQALVAAIPTLGPLSLTAAAAPLAAALGLASSRLIERPALRLKTS